MILPSRLESLNLIEIRLPNSIKLTGGSMRNKNARGRTPSVSHVLAVLAIGSLLAVPVAIVEAAKSKPASPVETTSSHAKALADAGGQDRVAGDCTYTIDPTSKNLPAIAIGGNVSVMTQIGSAASSKASLIWRG